MGLNCFKATEPLQGDSLLCTTKSAGVPGIHLIDLGGWKAEYTLEPPIGFEQKSPGLAIQCPKR